MGCTLQHPAPPSRTARRRSLEDVHATVSVDHKHFFRRCFAFAGPAYMVSVGYMDPGNWATDIEGGSRFGYELLWVLLLSNALALLLQTLAARMGIVAGRDLAQASRELYSRPITIALWVLSEIAIAACDLAEVIGTIIGLNLLFGLPLHLGLVVTLCDTFLLLAIQKLGIRKMEAFILMLILTIGLCFILEIFWARPLWGQVAQGLLPTLTSHAPFFFQSNAALYIAIGILGATVMPHNLYLHSALVQSRSITRDTQSIRRACRYNLVDTTIALNAAFFVNAALLILAATVFFRHGIIVREIQDAYLLLPQFLGTRGASIAFAVALLCAGQSSTLTGTLAGQIVMEGFLHIRLRPWVRRLLTRFLAIIPAAVVIGLLGAHYLTDLLVLSQVVLSLQLIFAVVPLIQFTGSRDRMGPFTNRRCLQILAWGAAGVIFSLNAFLVVTQLKEWSGVLRASGSSSPWLLSIVLSVVFGCAFLLLWILMEPTLRRRRQALLLGTEALQRAELVAHSLQPPQYRRIGVAVENVPQDQAPLAHAVAIAQKHHAELVILHVVDGVGSQWYGAETADEESRSDHAYVRGLANRLRTEGVRVRGLLRFGNPAEELLAAVKEEQLDFIVLRSHGHRFLGDRFFGHTIDALRHAARIPLLAVRD